MQRLLYFMFPRRKDSHFSPLGRGFQMLIPTEASSRESHVGKVSEKQPPERQRKRGG